VGVGVGCHRFWGRCWSGFRWVLEWVLMGLVGGICNGLSWWVLRWFMQWDLVVDHYGLGRFMPWECLV
jgi:hypothetical protein